jgi:hypothetical protein
LRILDALTYEIDKVIVLKAIELVMATYRNQNIGNIVEWTLYRQPALKLNDFSSRAVIQRTI